MLCRAAGSDGAFGVEGDGAVRIRVNGEYTAVESLVGNAGQSAGSSESLESYDVAQGFSTGSGHGWALDGIDVVLSEVSDTEELSVALHAGDPAGTAVAELAAGGSLAVGVNSLSCPDSWSQDGARNPWSAPTTELWAPTGTDSHIESSADELHQAHPRLLLSFNESVRSQWVAIATNLCTAYSPVFDKRYSILS